MQFIIRFRTSKFDVTKEDPNDINQIFGQSLLIWLKDKIDPNMKFQRPMSEDWGWYSYVEFNDRKYLIGSTAVYAEDAKYEWIFQVHKQRTLFEKIMGKEKMKDNDECFVYFYNLFSAQKDFENVELE